MGKKDETPKDFWRLLAQAKSHEASKDDGLDPEPALDSLSRQEEKNYEEQASTEAESLAEIKKAQALSDAKFSKLKRRLLKGQLRRQRQNTKMRRIYASKAYRFVWMWSLFFFCILMLSGFKDLTIDSPSFKLISKFSLDTPVLIALITGVTVNIVAVFIIVMRNLFPSAAQEERDAKINDQAEKEDKK
ncbi:hypothetical protein ABN147_07200 [Klebsiella oxytoca]|uniref:hypothetical protein n=1 Tax=Klebsiella oxytoca TaxID=571 RepID=UPI0032DA96E2